MEMLRLSSYFEFSGTKQLENIEIDSDYIYS